jgi:hypothetical protein
VSNLRVYTAIESTDTTTYILSDIAQDLPNTPANMSTVCLIIQETTAPLDVGVDRSNGFPDPSSLQGRLVRRAQLCFSSTSTPCLANTSLFYGRTEDFFKS